jgi:hypothetical protein
VCASFALDPKSGKGQVLAAGNDQLNSDPVLFLFGAAIVHRKNVDSNLITYFLIIKTKRFATGASSWEKLELSANEKHL